MGKNAHKGIAFLKAFLYALLLMGSASVCAQEGRLQQESLQHKRTKIVSSQPDDVALTIYRDNLAFITETRTVDLPKGRSTISFEGVSDLMIPQTALLREFGALTLERNFDYDLLGQASLFEKSIGKTVYLHRTDKATGKARVEEAIIVSAGRGVVMDIGGFIEVFDCSGLLEKVSFTALPKDLKAQPTLSIDVVSDKAGPQNLTISYLASGFDWQADYILRLKGEGKADLAGWLTMTNGTAVSIKNAPTAIIAGALQRLDETKADKFYGDYFHPSCWPRGSTKEGSVFKFRSENRSASPLRFGRQLQAEREGDAILVTGSRQRRAGFAAASSLDIAAREDIGDYKLYRTPNPTTVAAYQTKQVMFLDKPNVDVTQYFVFDLNFGGEPREIPAKIRYDIDNKRDGILGEPLPEGTVRVMTKGADGGYLFLGEDDVRDLAVDLPVEVTAADSNSVRVETKILLWRQKKITKYRTQYEADFEHRITNANDYPVLVEVTQNRDGVYAPLKILSSTVQQEEDSAYPKWRLEVEAQSEMVFNATVEWN